MNSTSASRLAFEGELTIYRAHELKTSLLAALAEHTALEIDLAKVTEIDSAGVQLLLLARRSASAEQIELRFVGHSQAVLSVLGLLNLGAPLGAEFPAVHDTERTR